MSELQARAEALRKVHVDMSAMPDPQPEQIEAFGEDAAELLRDIAAAVSELPPTQTSATTEMIMRVVAVAMEALTTLDGDE